MKRLAYGLILAGVVMMAFPFFMDVSVTAPGMVYDDPALIGGRVANIDLIGQRTLAATVGGALFISGWLALIAHYIRAPRPPE